MQKLSGTSGADHSGADHSGASLEIKNTWQDVKPAVATLNKHGVKSFTTMYKQKHQIELIPGSDVISLEPFHSSLEGRALSGVTGRMNLGDADSISEESASSTKKGRHYQDFPKQLLSLYPLNWGVCAARVLEIPIFLRAMRDELNYQQVSKALGVQCPRDSIRQALTLPEISTFNYERMEFFGDSILGFIVANCIYQSFPDASPGEMTVKKNCIVQNSTLTKVFNTFDFSKNVLRTTAELSDKQKADIIEALTPTPTIAPPPP